MKRISLAAALLGAIVLAVAGIASAGTPAGTVVATTGKSAIGGASGNGTQNSHYTATYSDPLFGSVTCTGNHQVKKNQQPQDIFTCTSTTGFALTNSTPGQAVNAPWGWYSDYDGTYTTNLSGTVSADGMSYTAVATY
jgi:hypothetical protein